MASTMNMLPVLLNSQAVAAVAFAIALGFIIYYVQHRARVAALPPIPPGPPGHWLFGNTLPRTYVHRKFEDWVQEYGPVFSLRLGFRVLVVVGRHQAAVDIMEKEGAYTADRPRIISAGETLSGNMRTLLVGAGSHLRKLRKALHAQLQPSVVPVYGPVQMRAAKNHILDILSNPSAHQLHAKRYAASVIMSLAYGKTTPTSYSDPEVQQVNKCLTKLGAVMAPGAYMVDAFPILRFVPGYLSDLKRAHQEELQLFKEQLLGVKKKMTTSDTPPSFAKFILEQQEQLDLSDEELSYLAGSMFGAGSDTTAAAISIVVMAAALFPEQQAQVQEELDSVIGHDRAPAFNDQNVLPYTTAFVLETFRWRPVSVGGFPHRATKDIIWQNYRIPKGATVIGSHWSISHDPTVFPDPETFDLHRWIKDGRVKDDLKSFNFGFGRRICPGMHVATRSVFINTALMLWAFNITQDSSSPIDSMAFTSTANMHPLPFKACFEVRLEGGTDAVKSVFEGYAQ